MVSIENAILGIVIASCVAVCIYDVELNVISKRLHNRSQRYRRLSIWLPLGITYSLFYTTRYSIIAGNIRPVREMLGFSISNFGLVFTCGFWTYAVTAPFTGYLADRIGGKFSLLIATSGAALSNILLGVYFSALEGPASLAIFCIAYSFNIFFQGFGTAAIIKINGTIYSKDERGIFSGLFNVLITSGYFFALALCPRLLDAFGWEFVFILPGVGLACCVLVILVAVPKSPSFPETSNISSQKPDIEAPPALPPVLEGPPHENLDFLAISNEAASAPHPEIKLLAEHDEVKVPEPQQKVQHPVVELMKSPSFKYYLVAIMCSSWVRDGLLTWMYSFFGSVSGTPIDTRSQALIGGAVTFGGFLGGILCGAISDLCFNKQRIPPILLFSFCQLSALVALFLARFEDPIVLAIIVFFICIFLLGNYTLLSYTVPTDLPSHIVGVAAGIMTAGGYIASGFSGILLGTTIESVGYFWGWFFTLLLATTLGGIFVLVAFLRGRKQEAVVSQQPEVTVQIQLSPQTFSQTPAASSPETALLQSSATIQELVQEQGVVVIAGAEFIPVPPQQAQVVPPAVSLTPIFVPKNAPLRNEIPVVIRTAGIQDEFLRTQWDSTNFHQWSNQGKGVGDRMNWRFQSTNPRDQDRKFIAHRLNDPTSYFGSKKEKLLPY